MSSTISRRDLLFGRLRHLNKAMPSPTTTTTADLRAIIMGRHCLAYRHVTCSTCYERCPEEGAIAREQGLPRVVTDKCTGCRICHDVCPAPTNAVLMIERDRQPNATEPRREHTR